AGHLLQLGHRVCLIENRPTIVERLRRELEPEVVLLGDGSSPSMLEKAGIREANVLAAVTGEDETNLVITTLGRFEFHVPRTIARVNNPKNAWLFNQEMGVDIAVDQTDIMAKLIVEEMSLGDMMILLRLRSGEYSIVEERVDPQALVVQKAVKEIQFPKDCTLVGIFRNDQLIIPKGETVFQPYDEVIAIAHTQQIGQLAKLFGAPG
ncbi:MAG: TrkA family potassium uptake protein, partial [Anaerolineales bacterium]|nr:TrkA family potassium uptake protein [Anaerolineales bacterium]MDW8445942.1 TrkA family potassium uptake protein [Anaerolineales bacterium]